MKYAYLRVTYSLLPQWPPDYYSYQQMWDSGKNNVHIINLDFYFTNDTFSIDMYSGQHITKFHYGTWTLLHRNIVEKQSNKFDS